MQLTINYLYFDRVYIDLFKKGEFKRRGIGGRQTIIDKFKVESLSWKSCTGIFFWETQRKRSGWGMFPVDQD